MHRHTHTHKHTHTHTRTHCVSGSLVLLKRAGEENRHTHTHKHTHTHTHTHCVSGQRHTKTPRSREGKQGTTLPHCQAVCFQNWMDVCVYVCMCECECEIGRASCRERV